MKINNQNLIWIDLEMTGLNPNIHKIIEIAVLVTDSNLKIISKGLNIAIYQNVKDMLSMDAWNKKVHTNTGLVKRVRNSIYNEYTAEKKIISFLKKMVPIKISPICGNSIGQDRRFLFKYMPNLEQYFHYRQIDVSSIKELAYRWNPEILKKYIKKKIIKH